MIDHVIIQAAVHPAQTAGTMRSLSAVSSKDVGPAASTTFLVKK